MVTRIGCFFTFLGLVGLCIAIAGAGIENRLITQLSEGTGMSELGFSTMSLIGDLFLIGIASALHRHRVDGRSAARDSEEAVGRILRTLGAACCAGFNAADTLRIRNSSKS